MQTRGAYGAKRSTFPEEVHDHSEEAPRCGPDPRAAAALAQPTVTGRVFGLLNLNLQNTRQSGVANRFAISTDSSNVGWLGDAEIQPWLKLLARCETTANINGISVSGVCN